MIQTTKRNSIIISISALVLALIVAGVAIFAWFDSLYTSFVSVVGDTRISVSGEYAVAVSSEPSPEYHALNGVENVSLDIDPSQEVLFKFTVTNLSERDATLAVRMNNLSECIFTNFLAYYSGNTSVNLYDNALQNNLKLSYRISQAYYEILNKDTGLPDKTDITLEKEYIWEYSAGQRFIEDVLLPAKTKSGETPVTLYFRFVSSQSTYALADYVAWLCGAEGATSPSFGQTECAKMLNSTYAALSDSQKTVVNNYLAAFHAQELRSLSPESGVPILYLKMDYLEFIGENVAEHIDAAY